MKESKYEVTSPGSNLKVGTILVETESNKEEIKLLLDNGVVTKLDGDLMFDASSSVHVQPQ